ncbi:MAG: DUF11 domain-containing protein [Caldilineaceae bacterium]|nr:DUF11 domain-containing protein [Caldilineaceae bacterium]
MTERHFSHHIKRSDRRLFWALCRLLLVFGLLLQSAPAFAAAIPKTAAATVPNPLRTTQHSGLYTTFFAPVPAGTITNTVNVGSTTTDLNPVNNTAVQTTTVTSVADLQISKTDGVATLLPGTSTTYTIIVTNAGPSAVSGATVVDTLPAAITSATWSCSASAGSSCSATTGTNDINTTVDLAVNGTATFTVQASVIWSATGTLANTATVAPPAITTDPTPSNNSSTDTNTLLTGILTGTVYVDQNDSNSEDGGEGLPGVTIVITTSVGTTFTVTTDSSGHFTATVPAGNTQVDVDDSDLPTGVVQIEGNDPSTVNVPAGGSASDINGYELQGQLYGHIFEDINGNGVQDNGEPDLPNVDVIVTDTFGVTQTVTTDGNGNYTATVPIRSLTALTDTATVDVVESTLPAGALQTAGTDPTTVTVQAGTATDAGDDGYQRQGLVTGVVYTDENGDGAYTPGVDTPFANVTVLITDSNGIPYTIVTDADGVYSQVVPAGPTVVDVDDNDPDLPDGLVLTGGSTDPTTVIVPGGGTAVDDTGYVLLANIGDRVWLDRNGDGLQSADEPGLADVVITLTLPDNSILTTTTGPDGYYNFGDLRPGTYTIAVDPATLPAGVTQTGDRDSTFDHATTLTLVSNGSVTDADFGYQGNSSLGDSVWNDRNGNGVTEVSESGIPAVVVTLTMFNGWVITTTTSPTGAYHFGGLIPGLYTVTVDSASLPAGAAQTHDRDSVLDHTTTVTLAENTQITNADFGYQQQGTLFGHLYEDVNGSGSQDSSEPNLGNVTVVITDSLGVTHTLTTDANGNYTVTLPIGTATVDVDETTLPAGAVQTEGTDPTPTTVIAGEATDAGNDGYQRQGLVEGVVYLDVNNNGLYNPGVDLPLNNVSVVITDSNGVTYTVLTDANGNFSQIVPAGTTEVNVVDADLPADAMIENGFTDPVIVTVPGGSTATTSFPYVEPLSIDKDVVTPNVVAGTQVTYTIVVHNSGATALTTVTVSDTLPSGFTYASSTLAAIGASRTATSEPTIGDTIPTWGAWTINPGGTVTVTLVADIASSVAAGVYDNTAYARSDQTSLVNDDGTAAQDDNTPPGRDPENDEDVTVTTVADLAVAKYDNPDPVVAGTTLTYTIVVTNYGPSDAQDVVITDTLSADVALVSAVGCTVNGNRVVCDFGTIANGEHKSVTIVVTVDPDLVASTTDAALVTAPAATPTTVAATQPVEPATNSVLSPVWAFAKSSPWRTAGVLATATPEQGGRLLATTASAVVAPQSILATSSISFQAQRGVSGKSWSIRVDRAGPWPLAG